MPIVSNSGPILSFVRANHLDLLQKVVGALIVPEAVYDDLVTSGAGKPGAITISKASWITRRSVRDRLFVEQLPSKLHLGEREAIALARELGAPLLIDEREARKEAAQLGLDYFGSLRILKQAKDTGIIFRIRPVLDDLIRAGMYMSKALYEEFLRQVGEQ